MIEQRWLQMPQSKTPGEKLAIIPLSAASYCFYYPSYRFSRSYL